MTPAEPDHDWTARFFNDVQDVSSKELQSLWAKVLAGEVEQKGSVSVRALQVLKNLDRETAAIFRGCCSKCVYLTAYSEFLVDARVPSLGSNAADNGLALYDLSFRILTRLSEHGLILHDYGSWTDYSACRYDASRPGLALPFRFQGAPWILTPADQPRTKWDGRLTGVSLSLSGRELARVVDLEPAENFGRDLRQFFKVHGWVMTPVRIERDNGGSRIRIDDPEPTDRPGD